MEVKATKIEEKKNNLVIFKPESALTGTFTEEELGGLRKAAGFDQVTKAEMPAVLYKCAKMGLDPLLGEITAIRRGPKLSVEPTISGFRKIAVNSGQLAGSEVEFGIDASLEKRLSTAKMLSSDLKKFIDICNQTGESPGLYAKATVSRKLGETIHSYDYTAFAKEYFLPQGKWMKGHIRTMLSVRAESQALRKAFCDSLSGVYSQEEMEGQR